MLEDVFDHFTQQLLVVDSIERADIEQAGNIEDIIVVDDVAEPLRCEEILLDERSEELERGRERLGAYG